MSPWRDVELGRMCLKGDKRLIRFPVADIYRSQHQRLHALGGIPASGRWGNPRITLAKALMRFGGAPMRSP
ncbi:hypothetical protein CO654_25175 [Rhizobium sp. L18]|nr:hypothetical protein CO654_25175 [Rhizobium sp. L18]